jgi:hypothetical protein
MFHNFYLNMPMEIHPTEVDTMVQYTVAQHLDLVLFLRERKSLSLQQMFVDAEEVEYNLLACGKLQNQSWNEHENGYEQQISDLLFHLLQNVDALSSDSCFYSDLIETDFPTVRVVEKLYQQDDSPYTIRKFSSYVQKDDYDLNFLGYFHQDDFAEGSDQFLEEETDVLGYLTVDMTDRIYKEIVTQNDDLVAHVVPTPGINESNRLPSDFYDTFALKSAEDIYVQDNNQQLQGKFVAQNFYEDQDACDRKNVDVGSNTLAAFVISSNASSSDEITTLNLKEGYGQWKYDLGFHLLQHTNASLSYFYSSPDPETNKSIFSILEANYIDDYHKDELAEDDDQIVK